MFYAIDVSMFDDQDYLRTADGLIALYPSKGEALEAVSVLGGVLVPYIIPASGLCAGSRMKVV